MHKPTVSSGVSIHFVLAPLQSDALNGADLGGALALLKTDGGPYSCDTTSSSSRRRRRRLQAGICLSYQLFWRQSESADELNRQKTKQMAEP